MGERRRQFKEVKLLVVNETRHIEFTPEVGNDVYPGIFPTIWDRGAAY